MILRKRREDPPRRVLSYQLSIVNPAGLLFALELSFTPYHTRPEIARRLWEGRKALRRQMRSHWAATPEGFREATGRPLRTPEERLRDYLARGRMEEE